jgi:predicted DNA-binding transcriptional regulator AlpA
MRPRGRACLRVCRAASEGDPVSKKAKTAEDAAANKAAAPSAPPPVRLLSKAEVLAMVGVSFPTVWGWMRAGTFPVRASSARRANGFPLTLRAGLLGCRGGRSKGISLINGKLRKSRNANSRPGPRGGCFAFATRKNNSTTSPYAPAESEKQHVGARDQVPSDQTSVVNVIAHENHGHSWPTSLFVEVGDEQRG